MTSKEYDKGLEKLKLWESGKYHKYYGSISGLVTIYTPCNPDEDGAEPVLAPDLRKDDAFAWQVFKAYTESEWNDPFKADKLGLINPSFEEQLYKTVEELGTRNW